MRCSLARCFFSRDLRRSCYPTDCELLLLLLLEAGIETRSGLVSLCHIVYCIYTADASPPRLFTPELACPFPLPRFLCDCRAFRQTELFLKNPSRFADVARAHVEQHARQDTSQGASEGRSSEGPSAPPPDRKDQKVNRCP